jgi:FeS assembly SUF system protein
MWPRKKKEEPVQTEPTGELPVTPADTAAPEEPPVPEAELRENIIAAMRTVFDPEIPVNIYDIGLIYELNIDPNGHVGVKMTLTSPMCPAAESLPPEVERKVASVPGVTDVTLDLVWEPTWGPAMMSEDAKLLLNIGG